MRIALALAALCVVPSLSPAQEAKRSEAETKAIVAIKKSGAHVLEIAQNDAHLEVDYHLNVDTANDEALAPLASLKDAVVHLHLGGTKVTEKGLEHTKNLTGLPRPH